MKLYKKPHRGWTKDTLPKDEGFYWAEYWFDDLGKAYQIIIIQYVFEFATDNIEIYQCGVDSEYVAEEFGWFYGPIEKPEIEE